jgi:hypothetical protein
MLVGSSAFERVGRAALVDGLFFVIDHVRKPLSELKGRLRHQILQLLLQFRELLVLHASSGTLGGVEQREM